MINIINTPGKYTNKIYQIVGDNKDELIKECLMRIRPQSQEFYKEELPKDLAEKKKSIISCHAGCGNFYEVILL